MDEPTPAFRISPAIRDAEPALAPASEEEWLTEHAAKGPVAPGLYLVGTPIGNLEDISLRALRVLRGVDRIACEDTRQTQKLLNRFAISTPTVSYHQHNEQERAAELLPLLQRGGRIAVVSDAGMPGISDPGVHLARAAAEAGVPVIPIPGASAALAALVGSGLATDRFLFAGFPPSKAGARRSHLAELAASAPAGESLTLVLYEAPHRIVETLADVEAVWGTSTRVVLARELTKMHEEFLRGTVAEVRATLAAREVVRGEMVLLIESRRPAPQPESSSIAQRVAQLAAQGSDEKDALKRVARERGLSKSDAYRELQRERARR